MAPLGMPEGHPLPVNYRRLREYIDEEKRYFDGAIETTRTIWSRQSSIPIPTRSVAIVPCIAPSLSMSTLWARRRPTRAGQCAP